MSLVRKQARALPLVVAQLSVCFDTGFCVFDYDRVCRCDLLHLILDESHIPVFGISFVYAVA